MGDYPPFEILGNPILVSQLVGANTEDWLEAFQVFARSCKAIVEDHPHLRPGVPVPPDLKAI